MNWNRAGRPAKIKDMALDDVPWTKDELSIVAATKESAMIMLAIAVVRQWIKDGRPEADMESVRPWIGIIRDSLRDKDDRLREQEAIHERHERHE